MLKRNLRKTKSGRQRGWHQARFGKGMCEELLSLFDIGCTVHLWHQANIHVDLRYQLLLTVGNLFTTLPPHANKGNILFYPSFQIVLAN